MSKNLPSIKDLYSSRELAVKNDQFTSLMNQPPKGEWVKIHPFIKGYKYLPIERVEFLLKSLFKKYRIEVLREGQSFNGVYVVVRVHYLHPVSGEMEFHDGIGAMQLQTAKGTSAADLANINNGALSMAYPAAKTEAVKNACKSFGKLFGSDLSRKEEIHYSVDLTLMELNEEHPSWNKAVEAIKSGNFTIDDIKDKYEVSEETEAKIEELCK